MFIWQPFSSLEPDSFLYLLTLTSGIMIRKSIMCIVSFFLFLFFHFALIASAFNTTNDPGRFIKTKLVDYKHIYVKAKIDTMSRLFDVEVVLDFKQLRSEVDSIVLACPGFQIESLTLDEKVAKWSYKNDLLVVFTNQFLQSDTVLHQLEIHYQVRPTKEMYFVGWDDSTFTMRRQIWSHRPYGWLPFADDRLTMDFEITFNKNYQVFTNGERINVVENSDQTKTWHYRLDREHPFFSTALVIGKYSWSSFTSDTGTPVELWFYPEKEKDVEATYQFMNEMFTFCENELGTPYPYKQYRQAPVADYLYGGMETTTSTVFGDYMHIDRNAFWERNYINVNIHELSHNWFGNDLSHLRPSDVWLTESFATYYAKLFEKEIFGENHYQWERWKELQRTLAASLKDQYAVGSSQGGVERWYPKGSLVLDMLRDELGNENFQKAIRYYLQKHHGSEVWTPNLIQAIYESTGISVDWFFEQWIHRGGEPHYHIQYEDNGPGLLFKVEQLQLIDSENPPFKAMLHFEIGYADGSRKMYSIMNDSQLQLFVIPKEMPVLYVLFDPGNKILKKETYVRSRHDRYDQLLNTPGMIDRFRALRDMDTIPLDDKRSVLSLSWKNNTFHMIRAEILKQLASDESDIALNIFSEALSDQEPLVRRAALQHLGQHHASLRQQIMVCLNDSSYSNQAMALKALHLLDPGRINHYLRLTDQAEGFPGKIVRIAWLETAIGSGKRKHLTELISYIGKRYDFKTRILAIETLMRLNYLDDEAADLLIEAALHWNFRLNPVAKSALRQFELESEFHEMIQIHLKARSIQPSELGL